MLSDLFWIGRYAERSEHMARLLTVTRERYHEYRYRRTMDGSECVPVLLTALGAITGTDTGAGGDYAEMVATAPTTLWALTADRHRPGSLAQSVERLGLAARAVRDQMSNDTWMVLSALERALLNAPDTPPDSKAEGDAFLSSTSTLTLAGMLALSGVVAESMVHDVGWTMMDIGKRIERALALTALLRATMTTVRTPGAEQTITESTLVVCESLVIYRRRNPGAISVAGVAELVLFDMGNPARWSISSSACAAICDRCPGPRVRRDLSGWSTRSRLGCAGSSPTSWSRSAPRAGVPTSPPCCPESTMTYVNCPV